MNYRVLAHAQTALKG
jgi:hypothetical protein